MVHLFSKYYQYLPNTYLLLGTDGPTILHTYVNHGLSAS